MNELSIGKKIADGREAKGLSRAQLAQILCVTPQAAGKWERGESLPDIIMLLKIADILGQDLNYFSDGERGKGDEGGERGEGDGRGEGGTKARQSRQTEKSKARNMSMAVWKDADFSGLKNAQGKLGFSNVERCKFAGADLSGIKFKSNNMKNNDFSHSRLDDCGFSSSCVEKNDFFCASMLRCVLKSSNVAKNSFLNADLTGATIYTSNLIENDFSAATLNETEFNKSNLKKTEFSGEITDCSFIYCTFKACVFKDATLKNTFFKGGNLKGASFINCRADKITLEFLKSAKADTSAVAVID